MADENLPIWKVASKDNQHPLYKATWLLFSEKFNLKFVDKQLADKKEETIEYLFLILDSDDLYYEESFGSGFAPIHACELLGHWQVTEAIPRLMRILVEEDDDEMAWSRAALAMENMGEAAIEPTILAFENNEIDSITTASILSNVGKGNDPCFDFIKIEFEKQTDEMDISFYANFLLNCFPFKAILYLEERLDKVKYSKAVHADLQAYIQDAKEGKYSQE